VWYVAPESSLHDPVVETEDASPVGQPALKARRVTLVWIDSREALLVRWQEGRSVFERVESEVPARHAATGHVRHDPSVRHGGGSGHLQAAAERYRLEHLRRFLADVAGRLPPDDELLILGPGTVREQLVHEIGRADAGRPAPTVTSEAAPRLTRRQLVARLRRLIDDEPPRRVVGTRSASGSSLRRS
jgi:hypothetical protein